MTLLNALQSIDQFSWDTAFYIQGKYPWSADALCAVAPLEEIDENDSNDPVVKANGLEYVLNTHDVQGIVKNAKLQIATPSDEQLVAAFNYYVANDAFITL